MAQDDVTLMKRLKWVLQGAGALYLWFFLSILALVVLGVVLATAEWLITDLNWLRVMPWVLGVLFFLAAGISARRSKSRLMGDGRRLVRSDGRSPHTLKNFEERVGFIKKHCAPGTEVEILGGTKRVETLVMRHEAARRKQGTGASAQTGAQPNLAQADLMLNLGSLWADAAKTWAFDAWEGLHLDRRLYSAVPNRGESLLEMYILHLAAFVEATQEFGADGVTIQSELIEEAPVVAKAIVADTGGTTSRGRLLRDVITDALHAYKEFMPLGGGVSSIMKFGSFVATRLSADEPSDPILALALVRIFQSAQSNCSDTLAEILAISSSKTTDGARLAEKHASSLVVEAREWAVDRMPPSQGAFPNMPESAPEAWQTVATIAAIKVALLAREASDHEESFGGEFGAIQDDLAHIGDDSVKLFYDCQRVIDQTLSLPHADISFSLGMWMWHQVYGRQPVSSEEHHMIGVAQLILASFAYYWDEGVRSVLVGGRL